MDTMIEILKYIQSFSNPFLDSFFELVTMLGENIFFIAVIAVFYWCFNKTFGYKLAFVYLTSGAFNTIIKEIVKFPRPIGYEGIRSSRIKTAGGYSFPSGHTQQASSLFITLMMEFRKKWLYIIGVLGMLFVGLSRMYLGVHWPTDVIGGLMIGILWTITVVKIFDWSKDREDPALLGVLVIPMMICLLLIKTATYYKAVGALTAMWAGYLIEDKYIHYVTKAVWWKQLIKLVVGLLGIILIRVYIKMLLPLSIYSDFFRYALMGLWMTLLSPIVYRICKIEERETLKNVEN
ncbi:phosphatase PAP2 family protein [Lachnospiraceae bacterium MD1]|uniref:Phosphatase PAP2 family protein n=1 Tax=Variimorphobacter saccharofermentans TaxID=2755051 RepID=A0A839K3I1_9FIRM|nr:phosphatase PAP2 family protein [Variimorphobacter saccharofermentans]MBB2184465.1 phosphatase PAP2 family protein [Variimorphobacter saccharofermentans]